MRFWLAAVLGFLLTVAEIAIAMSLSTGLMNVASDHWGRRHYVLLYLVAVAVVSVTVASYLAILSYLDGA